LANKEPNRDDFEAGLEQQPKPEKLHDFEFGWEYKNSSYRLGATLYYMLYKDQLVLTGKINDVGAYARTNIPDSYRMGIELQGKYNFSRWLNAGANLALSRNRIKNFTEYFDDYDEGNQKSVNHGNTDISFSPAIVGGASLNIFPLKKAEINLLSKYVSRQYLDNTSNKERSLDPFFVQDIRMSYAITGKLLKQANIILQVNNVFDNKYEPNGYTYSYIYGGEMTTENYYFPMAGLNYMVGLSLKF
jgi:iron complex outermembrane receptor protein